MINNIIFDWSGVIKDAFEAHVWVVNKMLEIFGSDKRFTYDELKENWVQPHIVHNLKELENIILSK